MLTVQTSILSHKWICLLIFDFLMPVRSTTSLSQYIDMMDEFREIRSTIPIVCTQWYNFIRDSKNFSVNTFHTNLFGTDGSIRDLQWRYKILRTLQIPDRKRTRFDRYLNDDAKYMDKITTISNIHWKLYVYRISIDSEDDITPEHRIELRNMFHYFPADGWVTDGFSDETVSTSVGLVFGPSHHLVTDTHPSEGNFDQVRFYIRHISFETIDSTIIYCEDKIYVDLYFKLSDIKYNISVILFSDCRIGIP
jgi:hypothetical protein